MQTNFKLRRSFTRLAIQILLPLLQIQHFGAFIWAQEFSAAGTYNFRIFGETTNIIRFKQSGVFRVRVWNCSWNIQVQADGEKMITEVGNDEHGDVIMLLRIDPTVPQDPKSQLNQEIGLIEPFVYPFGKTHPHLVTIWWAYASSCYLRTNGTSRVPPLLLHEADQAQLFYTDHKVDASIDFLSPPLRLPRNTSFREDGLVRRWPDPVTAQSGSPPTVRPRPGPFDKGFTNVLYKAERVTNINGMELPISVGLQEFAYIPRPMLSPRSFLFKDVRLDVTNVSGLKPDGSSTPAISRLIAITDNRFAVGSNAVPGIFFGTGSYNQGWMSRAEVERSRSYQDARLEFAHKRRIVRDDLEKRGKRKAFRTLILASIAAPVVLYVFNRAVKLVKSKLKPKIR